MVDVIESGKHELSLGQKLWGYVALTKPRIIELLLITTVPAMVLAERGWPGLLLVNNTLIGGTLSAAGANTLNSYADADIDAQMKRTAHRPLAKHQVPPKHALLLGVTLGAAGFLYLWTTTNFLAASISTAALFFYVFVYTLWLKRTTTQNIVIGGAAGAAPALVGWAAVTNTTPLGAWLLFLIVFLWTPPHFWALSLKYKEEYAAVNVPMLPVVKGVAATVNSILRYTVALVASTFAIALTEDLGWIYLGVAGAAGIWLTVKALQLRADPANPMSLFHASNIFLTLISAGIVADVLIFS